MRASCAAQIASAWQFFTLTASARLRQFLSSGRLLFGFNAVLIATILTGAALVPHDPRSVLVVAWPGQLGAANVIWRAHGSVLRAGSWAAAAIAKSDDPGFIHRLYAAGAVLVLNGGAARGCQQVSTNGNQL